MNLDGFSLSVLVKELKNECEHKQIQKILQIDKQSLLFKLSGLNSSTNLIMTVGAEPACYVDTNITNLPKEPSALCMFLRKHFENSRILTVEQVNADRIIKFSIAKLSLAGQVEPKAIYLELMGKYSNCIFVDEDNVILESLIHVTPYMSQERSVAPKLTYSLPPHSERLLLSDFNAEEITALLKQYQQEDLQGTVRYVFNGFGPQLMTELLYRLNLSPKADSTLFSEEQWLHCGKVLYQLGKEIDEATGLYEYSLPQKKKPIYSPVKLSNYEVEPLYQESLSPLIASSIREKGALITSTKELETLLVNALEKEKRRCKKIIEELEATTALELYKTYGDLLMINAYQPIDYQSSIDIENILVDPPEKISIPLKPGLSLSENANAYYKKYGKLKNRKIYGEEQRQQSLIRQDYLESILFSLSTVKDKNSLEEIKLEIEQQGLKKATKKHLQASNSKPNLLTISLEYGDILVGRNNKQNDYLTHRLAKANDLWFHALKIQGSHVVLRTKGTPSEEEITLAASYAAYYSKGKNDALVPVDYTQIKYVKKPNGAPLGYVIYSNQKTIYVKPINAEKQQ